MIGKMIGVMFLIVMLLFSVALYYQNTARGPVALEINGLNPEPFNLVEYGAVPVFADNLRFNHNDISYFIEDECNGTRREAMVKAFALFAKYMGVISFNEVATGDEADIDVGCSDDYIPMGERLFAAGEGGPSRIINTSVFKTIEKGKISLYSDPHCDYPIVEMHELGHVFGFDHSLDPTNIMYNVSNCEQQVSADMINLINDLYSIEALSDASISALNATLKGKYLNFNITVLNEGLLGIDSINLTIIADGEEIQVIDMGEIGIGYGRTMRATNVRLPSRNVDVIDFIIDKKNVVREFNEDNNEVSMTVTEI